MSSSTLALEYLIDAIAELELGSAARRRQLEDQARELGQQLRPDWVHEQRDWQRRREHVASVAHALLAVELDSLPAAPDHPLPGADQLLGALVGAAACRRLEPGSSADSVFRS